MPRNRNRSKPFQDKILNRNALSQRYKIKVPLRIMKGDKKLHPSASSYHKPPNRADRRRPPSCGAAPNYRTRAISCGAAGGRRKNRGSLLRIQILCDLVIILPVVCVLCVFFFFFFPPFPEFVKSSLDSPTIKLVGPWYRTQNCTSEASIINSSSLIWKPAAAG